MADVFSLVKSRISHPDLFSILDREGKETYFSSLKINSIDLISIQCDIEEFLEIELPGDTYESWQRVDDIFNSLENLNLSVKTDITNG